MALTFSVIYCRKPAQVWWLVSLWPCFGLSSTEPGPDRRHSALLHECLYRVSLDQGHALGISYLEYTFHLHDTFFVLRISAVSTLRLAPHLSVTDWLWSTLETHDSF
jgi:hypothetical protein